MTVHYHFYLLTNAYRWSGYRVTVRQNWTFCMHRFKQLKLKFCWFITQFLLASASFGTFGEQLFNFLNYFVWPRITIFVFHLLGKCYCWLTKEPPRTIVAICSTLRLIRTVWRTSTEIVILWYYNTQFIWPQLVFAPLGPTLPILTTLFG